MLVRGDDCFDDRCKALLSFDLVFERVEGTDPQFPLPRRLVGSCTSSFLIMSFDAESKWRGQSTLPAKIFS